MKTTIKVALSCFLACVFNYASAQLQPGMGFPNIFGGMGGQGQAAPVQGAEPVNDENDPPVAPKVDAEKQKEKAELELDNQIMQLQKEQRELQEELNALFGSGDTTAQDSINKTIKKKNLELLFLKEQVLLRTELEKYGIGQRELPPSNIFGHEYFRNPKIRKLNSNSTSVPSESYQLGPGDQIQVDVWGRAGYNGNYTVDEAGFVTIPRKQRVFVKGKSLSEVRSLLRSRFAQIVNLSGSNFNVSVSNSRSITVHVTGEVFYPGTYTVSALNSAFNILSISGGPSNIGTVRNIKIQRGGKTVQTFDLYKYLFGGEEEVFLQNNDYIIVGSIGNVVQTDGAIRKKSRFEMKQGEGFRELLSYSGGFETEAFRKDISLERIIDYSYYGVQSFNWDSLSQLNKNYILQDGDILNIKYINPDNLWIAKITGAIAAPGSYKVKEGEKLSSLLSRAGGLQRDAVTNKAYLIRTNPDLTRSYFTFRPNTLNKNEANDFKLESNDEIIILAKNDFREMAYLSTEQNVRNPIKIEYVKGLKASDLLSMSGGINEEGYSYRILVERTNPDFTKTILPIDVKEDGSFITDVLLERNDVLKVYTKPALNDQLTIEIFGEVNSAGSFQYFQNMTLKDLIIMANGTRSVAEFSRIEIASVVRLDEETGKVLPLEKTELKTYTISNDFDKDEISKTILINPLDQVFIRKAFFNDQQTIFLNGEVKYPGRYSIISKDETLLDVIERAGGFTSYAFLEGAEFRRLYQDTQSIRVIVDLKRAQNRPNSRFNYFLANNDTLLVPRIDQTVRITGEIENQLEDYVSSYYKKGKRARHYINNYAGGFAKSALKRKVYVQYANGQNVRTRNFILFKVFPKVNTGSTIYVPNKEENKGKKFNLDATLTKVLTTTTTVLTLFALINLAVGGN